MCHIHVVEYVKTKQTTHNKTNNPDKYYSTAVLTAKVGLKTLSIFEISSSYEKGWYLMNLHVLMSNIPKTYQQLGLIQVSKDQRK